MKALSKRIIWILIFAGFVAYLMSVAFERLGPQSKLLKAPLEREEAYKLFCSQTPRPSWCETMPSGDKQ
jgi:hypothetical protein